MAGNTFCFITIFLELAEAEEFDVYTRYAREITSTHSRDALQNLLARQDVRLNSIFE